MSPRDRDVRRPYTPARGTEAIPGEVWDIGTGVVEGEELARVRSRRPTPERLTRVETRQDSHEKTITELRVLVGRVDTKQDALIKSIEDEREERKKERETKAAFWRAVKLKVIGGVCSGTVLVAVARHYGWL